MTSPWMLQFGGHHPRLEYQDVGSHRGDDADTHVSDLECWDQARTTKRSRPKGMKASAMKAKQQAMLLDIIAERAGILNQSSAVARMARLNALPCLRVTRIPLNAYVLCCQR